MAKGAILKSQITEKILETFPGSFVYNNGKEIRINGTEDNLELQVKVVLTCAKTKVTEGEDKAIPGEGIAAAAGMNPPEIGEVVPQEPTQEEKARLSDLINKLGL